MFFGNRSTRRRAFLITVRHRSNSSGTQEFRSRQVGLMRVHQSRLMYRLRLSRRLFNLFQKCKLRDIELGGQSQKGVFARNGSIIFVDMIQKGGCYAFKGIYLLEDYHTNVFACVRGCSQHISRKRSNQGLVYIGRQSVFVDVRLAVIVLRVWWCALVICLHDRSKTGWLL